MNRVKTAATWVLIALLSAISFVLLLVLVSTAARAQAMTQEPTHDPVTFQLCDGNTIRFKRNGNDLEAWCPGKDKPSMTFKGCTQPKITRVGTMYKLTCVKWIPHQVIPFPGTGGVDPKM
jgi:hypothetical protein